MSAYTDVKDFHKKFGLLIQDSPVLPKEQKERDLRMNLLEEEYNEYMDAEVDNDIVEIADALADMIYIICGTAVAYGIPLDDVFAEVHRSNLTKIWPDGSVKKREDGKILKPDTFTKPDIKGVLDNALAS